MTAASELTVVITNEGGAEVGTSMTVPDTNGSYFDNDGTVLLLITAVASITLTVVGQNPCRFGASHNKTYGAISTGTHLVGPFAISHFCDAAQAVHITWAGTMAGNKVLAFKAGPTYGT